MMEPVRRHPTIHEFLLSRGIELNMRDQTQADVLNERLARFVAPAPVKQNLWQKLVEKLKDAGDF